MQGASNAQRRHLRTSSSANRRSSPFPSQTVLPFTTRPSDEQRACQQLSASYEPCASGICDRMSSLKPHLQTSFGDAAVSPMPVEQPGMQSHLQASAAFFTGASVCHSSSAPQPQSPFQTGPNPSSSQTCPAAIPTAHSPFQADSHTLSGEPCPPHDILAAHSHLRMTPDSSSSRDLFPQTRSPADAQPVLKGRPSGKPFIGRAISHSRSAASGQYSLHTDSNYSSAVNDHTPLHANFNTSSTAGSFRQARSDAHSSSVPAKTRVLQSMPSTHFDPQKPVAETQRTSMTLQTGMQLYGLQHSELFWESGQDTCCLMGWSDSKIVLAFRGTVSIRNAMADVQVSVKCQGRAGFPKIIIIT